jgi:ABC-type branched-subunit amino acid transport system substrate-binding protein
MQSKHSRWVLLLGVLSVTAAACGSSSSSSSSASTNTTQGVTGKTILIGNSAIESGPDAPLFGISQAFQDYFSYINAHGGVNGFKFKVVTANNGYVASQSVVAAKTLVFQDKVFALSVVGTTPTTAVIPMATQFKIPFLFVANGDLAYNAPSNVFGLEPSFSRDALFDAQYALKTLRLKTISYAYETSGIGIPPLKHLPAYINSHGGHFATSVGFSPNATDYSSYAAKLQAAGAKAVIVYSGVTNLSALQKASAAIGYHPTWFGFFASASPAYVQLAGAQANGTYVDNFLADTAVDTPAMKLMKEHIPASDVGLLGELGWSQAALIVNGVKAATKSGKKLTDTAFEHGLEGLTGTPAGAWNSVTFTPTNHAGATQTVMYEVKHGTFVPVTGLETLPNIPSK